MGRSRMRHNGQAWKEGEALYVGLVCQVGSSILHFAIGLGIFQDFAKEDLGDLFAGHVAQLS